MNSAPKIRAGCGVLVDLLGVEWPDLHRSGRPFWPHEVKALRQLMLDDLLTRSLQLPDVEREKIWTAVGPNMLVSDAARRTLNIFKQALSPAPSEATNRPGWFLTSGRETLSAGGQKRPADILILTVLPVERDAVLAAFNQDPRRKEDLSDTKGNLFYEIPVRSQRYGTTFRAWLAMIGRPRNVRCALFVSMLGKLFDFKTIVLLGIAGGNKKKVKLGDVVSSTTILDNDGGVDEYTGHFPLFGRYFGKKRHQPRVDVISHEGLTTNLLAGFSPDTDKWHKEISQIVSIGNRGSLKFSPDDATTAPAYESGLIQAGDRLKKRGELPETAFTFHDKLYAVEMEGAGFASACNAEQYEWFVVRGISDFGDPTKRDKKQAVAALSAALLLRQFLENTFQPPSEGEDLAF